MDGERARGHRRGARDGRRRDHDRPPGPPGRSILSRRRLLYVVLVAIAAIGLPLLAGRARQELVTAPVALVQAHAHNDYEHERPLLDALDHGFCSVEADIWLVQGQLLVAHDREKVDPARTLEALYLDPLHERVKLNGGRLYRSGPECVLLIDVKSQAVATYAALEKVLERYEDVLTTFRSGKVEHRGILAIVSGNSAPAVMSAEVVRYAALDGRFDDLRSDVPAELIPWISLDWKTTFTWSGSGAMPDTESRLLRQIVADAHQHGRKLRFWNTPDAPSFWDVLWDAKVDLIGADDLAALETFLRGKVTPLR